MQAIISRILPATNTRPTRIKASCARGSITISPTSEHDYSDAETHAKAAQALVDKFISEDASQYGTPKAQNPWGRARVVGQLPNGDFAHVFTA